MHFRLARTPHGVMTAIKRVVCCRLRRFSYHERSVSRLLNMLGFSHIGARPRHAGQAPEVLEDFKKLFPHAGGVDRASGARYPGRALVAG